MQLFGTALDVDERGEAVTGDTVLVLFNADHDVMIPFVLPATGSEHPWELVFDTAAPAAEWTPTESKTYDVTPCSVVVLKASNKTDDGKI